MDWISVEERLPNIGDLVFIYRPNDDIMQFDVDEWIEYQECPVEFSTVSIVTGEGWAEHEFDEITHWCYPKTPVD